jgi:Predicted O-methyltransferase
MIWFTSFHERILALKCTSSVASDEGARLSFLASQVPENGVIVELGSCWGRSACYLAAGLQASGRQARIHCVDLWDLGVHTPERHHAPGVFERFQGNLQSLGLWDYIHPIKSDTVAAARDWKTPIDLLFIDAGHKYEEVRSDYLAWSPFVKPGGVIAFHDYILDGHPDIVQCVEQDVIPSGQWEFIALHNRVWTARRKA